MKKIIFTLLFLLYSITNAQYHITYDYKISDISSTKENLYIQRDRIISIVDSTIVIDNANYGNTFVKKEIIHKTSYLKNTANNNIKTDTYFQGIHYLVEENAPKIEWKINEKNTKNILGYRCTEAKGTFRGTHLIAYFTEKIPISAGPFKFSGLNGLILEIYEEGKDYNSWVATAIDTKFTKEIPYKSYQNAQIISLKDYVELQQKTADEFLKKITKGVAIQRKEIKYGIEKIYEWE